VLTLWLNPIGRSIQRGLNGEGRGLWHSNPVKKAEVSVKGLRQQILHQKPQKQ